MLFAAWRATGDGKFVEEIERLYRCCESDDSCSPEPGERVSSGGKGLYLPSLMMELDPWHHQRWRDMMMGSFRTSAHAILPDGTGYTAGRNDPQTGTVVPVAARWGDLPAGGRSPPEQAHLRCGAPGLDRHRGGLDRAAPLPQLFRWPCRTRGRGGDCLGALAGS